MVFAIGQKFPLEIKILYPGDYYYFNVISNTIVLAYFYENPSFEEINCMKTGKCEFAVTEMQDVLFFLSKVGKMNWSDIAFSSHLTIDEFTYIPPEGCGYPINLMMVDRSTNVIKTMRTVAVSSRFSAELKTILGRNKQHKFDDAEYRKRATDIYSRYSTSELLEQATTYSKEFISMKKSA